MLIDLDPAAIAALREEVPPGTELIEGDGLKWLYFYGCQARPDWFVYCDPPYLQSAVKTRLRYRHVLSAHDHERLLHVLCGLQCCVAISGYPSDLYHAKLRDWRLDMRSVITRGGGMANECLWMNYPRPQRLHDLSFLGRISASGKSTAASSGGGSPAWRPCRPCSGRPCWRPWSRFRNLGPSPQTACPAERGKKRAGPSPATGTAPVLLPCMVGELPAF